MKAFGIELPILKSVIRQVMLGILGLALLIWGTFPFDLNKSQIPFVEKPQNASSLNINVRPETPLSVPQQTVVVVGDATAAIVAAELRKAKVSVTEDKRSIESTSIILIAQDATTGLMPVHKEIISNIARYSNRKPKLLWIFTKSSDVSDYELIELEELTVRELLTRHNLDGDVIPFAVADDKYDSRYQCLKGWGAIIQFVERKGLQ